MSKFPPRRSPSDLLLTSTPAATRHDLPPVRKRLVCFIIRYCFFWAISISFGIRVCTALHAAKPKSSELQAGLDCFFHSSSSHIDFLFRKAKQKGFLLPLYKGYGVRGYHIFLICFNYKHLDARIPGGNVDVFDIQLCLIRVKLYPHKLKA